MDLQQAIDLRRTFVIQLAASRWLSSDAIICKLFISFYVGFPAVFIGIILPLFWYGSISGHTLLYTVVGWVALSFELLFFTIAEECCYTGWSMKDVLDSDKHIRPALKMTTALQWR